MLQTDGLESSIDSNFPALAASMKRTIAKSRGEPNLTIAETSQFEVVSRPVFDRLKQQLLEDAVQDYASLNDDDIDSLILANKTPLARRFIAVMASSEASERQTLDAYVSETAAGIGEAYIQNRAYSPKYDEAADDRTDTLESRLLILTGNSAMCDEAIQNYFPTAIARQIANINFEKLSDADATRLRALFLVGIEDMGNRLKELKRAELRAAFSKDELNRLIALYGFPAVQTKIQIALATIPAGRVRNRAEIKAAFDEVLKAFPVLPVPN
jgi:hypothetical protein